MANIRVTSAEFLKAYGRFSSAAQREPVSITNHGRESLVLLSAEEYRRLKSRDQVALYPWELAETDIEALRRAAPPAEASRYDSER